MLTYFHVGVSPDAICAPGLSYELVRDSMTEDRASFGLIVFNDIALLSAVVGPRGEPCWVFAAVALALYERAS